MNEINDRIIQTFRKNVSSVYELVNFDRIVLEFAISQVSDLSDKLKNVHGIGNSQLNAENTVKALKIIRQNDSLRPMYQVISNQCVVLLVSYFGSSVGDLFKCYLTEVLKLGMLSPALRKEDIKLSLGELETMSYDILTNIGEIVVANKGISFQDMQSIARAFHDWLGYEPIQDVDVNNIIISQACRHAIVHSGGMVDKRLVKQVATAKPRNVKPEFIENTPIQFYPDEVEVIGESMVRYIERLIEGLGKSGFAA